MSESHGTTLILKRHEDLEKVAAYVKQQVCEKSIEQVGEDLSKDDDYVGLQINEEKNEIIWHDYGHHGDHLDFNPIAESVIKEFPGVEMECQQWYGQEGRNYFIVDGEWQEYTLWKFVAYIDGKGEEVQLEYKQLKDGRTEEENHEERDKICKEMAERLSRSHPDVEIAVYAYDRYEICMNVEEFYKAKDGRAIKECVDRGLVEIMDYFEDMEWVESIGHVLLHPMEFAAELIRRTRNGEDCYFATRMLMQGDTARYFSLIEPADKKWLMKQVDEREDICAIYCLLNGMHHKYKFWTETFVDEDTNEEVKLLRYEFVEGSTFEKNEGEKERLIQIVMENKVCLTIEELTKLCSEIDDNLELLLERIKKGDEEAAEHMGYKYAYGDEANGIFIDYDQAAEYMKLAGEEFDVNNYREEADPHDFEYTLKGDAETLGTIRTMVDNLCQRFGTPGNELGMFVPLGSVMQELVGSFHYEGNILSMEQPNPDCLILKTEANKGEPLLYALRQRYENLNIEIRDEESGMNWFLEQRG
jgi:hypothetical protein